MRSMQMPSPRSTADSRTSLLQLARRRMCFVVLLLVHLPVNAQSVAPEYRGSAEAGTPEGAIIAACACIGIGILVAVSIAYYRYHLHRQWQRIIDTTAQELREESMAISEVDEEMSSEKYVPLDDTKVHFKAYFQHSSIKDKPNTAMGHLLFRNHHHQASSTTTTNDSVGVESNNKTRTTSSIHGSGGDSMGRFTIVQGELIASTGKCYWLQDLEAAKSSSIDFCSVKRHQVLVTGYFDVSKNNDDGTAADGQKAIIFRGGKWQTNDGASGQISSLQFTPPLFL